MRDVVYVAGGNDEEISTAVRMSGVSQTQRVLTDPLTGTSKAEQIAGDGGHRDAPGE